MNRPALSPARCLTLAAALACAHAPALAQPQVAAVAAEFEVDAALRLAQAELERQVDVERHVFIDQGPDAFFTAFGDSAAETVVKGAPYCADAVQETVQWLPDGQGGVGNRIVQQRSTRLCRDGEGRTRQEVDSGGRKRVYLRDPVARENWVLDPERKTARRMGSSRSFGSQGLEGTAWRDYAERMRDWARGLAERARPGATAAPGAALPPPVPPVPHAPPVSPVPPMPVVITAPETRRAEVRVLRTAPGADAAAADWPMPPPAVSWRARTLAPRGPGAVTPLGTRDIEGLRAHGERTTWVIEAGRMGNEKPIQITREVWTAPDLVLTVSSRDFDPRSGEVSYRLKGLRRGEPDAALMRVPADYGSGHPPGPKASG